MYVWAGSAREAVRFVARSVGAAESEEELSATWAREAGRKKGGNPDIAEALRQKVR